MMRPAALAHSAALSLRPGPNPLAFPGLVVAAAAAVPLGFAVLTAPKLYADDIDRGASVGFETESRYRLRLVGYPSVLGAQSQVDWNGKRYGIHGEPRIFQRLPSDGSRRLRDRP